jgi:hypothetical protein
MPFVIDKISAESLSVNGADMCKIETPIFDIFPWPMFPKFQRTCTEVKDTSNQGLNYQGYKITGAIENFGSNDYTNYLGTIRVKNGNINMYPTQIPFKSNGMITYYQDSIMGTVSVSSPLSAVNKARDGDNGYSVYFDTEFVQFYSEDGDDLLIDIVNFSYESNLNVDPVSVMDYIMSFELELLTINSFEISYEYIEFLP